MGFPVSVYLLVSLGVGLGSAFGSGLVLPSICFMAGSFISFVGGGGCRASLWWRDRTQKVAGIVFAGVLAVAAQWLASGFMARLGDWRASGSLWCWSGFVLGFIVTSRDVAGFAAAPAPRTAVPQPAPPQVSHPVPDDRQVPTAGPAAPPQAVPIAAPTDRHDALAQYKRAAELGDANSQYRLGNAYAAGNGAPQSHAQAVRWWRLAAEQGHAVAQHSLGLAYWNGEGIPQDYVAAHVWFSIAATSHCNPPAPGHNRVFFNPSSEECIEELEPLMTRQQVAMARRRARRKLRPPGRDGGDVAN